MELLTLCCWRGTIILLVAFAASLALRKAPAAWRHFLWTAVMAGLVALPVMVQVMPKWNLQMAPGVLTPSETVMVQTDTASTVNAVAVRPAWNPALLVWLTGCALAAGWFLVGRVRTWRMMQRAVKADYARELMDGSGGHGVPVLESSQALTAFALGVWRPLVILPPAARDWPVERLRAALLHELMHVRRRDLLAQTIAQAACCLYWFHPLAWLAARQLRHQRERACDDAVLRHGIAAHDYAQHLVEMVRALGGKRVGAMAMAEPSDLEERVRALLDGRCNRRPLNWRAAAAIGAACAVVLACSAVTTAYAQPAADAPQATGSLSGAVNDPSGAFVPNARVTAKSVDGSSQDTAVSDSAGNYRFNALLPGEYAVEVTVPGFKVMRVQVTVASGKAMVINARLALGDVTETVSVTAVRPAAAAPAGKSTTPTRIQVGGNVQAAMILKRVQPVYPADLKANGVTGTVTIEALIMKDGTLSNLHVLNTDVDPELVTAATDAVSQWQFRPTLLNGQPVTVLTKIDVSFQLSQ
jgi:TonB family protein